MQHFIINIFNNETGQIVRNNIKFEGDLRTAKAFGFNLAKRLRLSDCSVYIYDKQGFVRGDRFLERVNYTKHKK